MFKPTFPTPGWAKRHVRFSSEKVRYSSTLYVNRQPVFCIAHRTSINPPYTGMGETPRKVFTGKCAMQISKRYLNQWSPFLFFSCLSLFSPSSFFSSVLVCVHASGSQFFLIGHLLTSHTYCPSAQVF